MSADLLGTQILAEVAEVGEVGDVVEMGVEGPGTLRIHVVARLIFGDSKSCSKYAK
jgi:hypothetical protein